MIKLLIADDEPLVCVGLQSMIKWEELDIEIIGTARNGQQAAELVERLRPDIVITDIKMPLKTGLELAEECAARYGQIPLFIILTSYEEFELVRRAIKIQAVDYLIKLELTPEYLREAVLKAISLLEQHRKADFQAFSVQQVSMQALSEKFFLRLYNNLFESEDQYKTQKAELGIEFSASAYVTAICTMEPARGRELSNLPLSGDHLPDDKLPALYGSTVQMLRETMGKSSDGSYTRCYISSLDMRHFGITFCIDRQDAEVQRKLLTESLLRAIATAHNYFNVSIRAAVGHTVNNPRRLDESYFSAQRLLPKTTPEQPLLFFDTDSEEGRTLLLTLRRNYKQRIVSSVQEYIRNNLDKRLSLNEVAVVFHISPGYLSQLFAKHADEGFVEYITTARIEAAKEMLARGDGKIYEIAEHLGFESAFYFSKVFKKAVGVSPREYLQTLNIK